MTSPSGKLLFPKKIGFMETKLTRIFFSVLLYSPRLVKVNPIEIAVYSPLRSVNTGNSYWDISLGGC